VDHSEDGSHIVWYKVTVSELSAASVLRVKHPQDGNFTVSYEVINFSEEISAFIFCFKQL
jgi:hypothetical protein